MLWFFESFSTAFQHFLLFTVFFFFSNTFQKQKEIRVLLYVSPAATELFFNLFQFAKYLSCVLF